MRNFAKRIIICETNGDNSADTQTPETLQVFEKLRPPLAALMGNGGFQALLSRALALARAEVPWLRSIHVKSDGALGGLEEIQAQLSLDAMFVGKVALLAQLLGLLVAFIGGSLTTRLVLEIWPNAALSDLELVKGDNHEEAK
jgi:hypothetical protein